MNDAIWARVECGTGWLATTLAEGHGRVLRAAPSDAGQDGTGVKLGVHRHISPPGVSAHLQGLMVGAFPIVVAILSQWVRAPGLNACEDALRRITGQESGSTRPRRPTNAHAIKRILKFVAPELGWR